MDSNDAINDVFALLRLVTDPEGTRKRLEAITEAVDSSKASLETAHEHRVSGDLAHEEARKHRAAVEGELGEERKRLTTLAAELQHRRAELDQRDRRFLDEHKLRVESVTKREAVVMEKESKILPLHEKAKAASEEAVQLRDSLRQKHDAAVAALKAAG